MSGITLRRVQRHDGPALIEMNRLSRTYHAPWVTPFTDDASFETWFAQSLTGPHVGLVARARQNGNAVGVINISQIVLGPFRSAYLGFYGSADTAGAGYMTDALDQGCDYAFNQLGLHRVEANIQPANARSLALVRRCGFNKEGFSPRYLKIGDAWRDHERWARLTAEFDGCLSEPTPQTT